MTARVVSLISHHPPHLILNTSISISISARTFYVNFDLYFTTTGNTLPFRIYSPCSPFPAQKNNIFFPFPQFPPIYFCKQHIQLDEGPKKPCQILLPSLFPDWQYLFRKSVILLQGIFLIRAVSRNYSKKWFVIRSEIQVKKKTTKMKLISCNCDDSNR